MLVYPHTESYPIDILIENIVTCPLGLLLVSSPFLCKEINILLIGLAQRHQTEETLKEPSSNAAIQGKRLEHTEKE